ncbi:DUF3606 domain-containing protein [Mucilaginibacter conchicola]|uniref:DUF3606 domain-containing protein n=1 Tax=Mucilaginibacter conchicola TaxID=2303333 RepID=A0A372NN96_9SPHI|nr:DUF3606 domain-containing protein [Mucilaginibacter conchicola]RFZ90087.1 DUF3606 domain-containing protein [Mucilaginibacter conchicola]
MATKGVNTDRKKVNSGEKYELKYEAQKLGISTQALVGAKRATGSNDRKVIEKYLAEKKKK